ncbi:hypothetical protein ACFQZE_02600 [Paenibacillus sp. GCM10027627]
MKNSWNTVTGKRCIIIVQYGKLSSKERGVFYVWADAAIQVSPAKAGFFKACGQFEQSIAKNRFRIACSRIIDADGVAKRLY